MTTIITPAPAHQKPSGKLYLSVSQLNLVNNTLTLVKLDAIAAGFADAIHNTITHRITPGFAGFYSIIGQVTFLNVIAGRAYDAAIKIGGTTWICFNYNWSGGGLKKTIPVSALAKLTAIDYVELWARSISGDNTVDIHAAEFSTFLSVQRDR